MLPSPVPATSFRASENAVLVPPKAAVVINPVMLLAVVWGSTARKTNVPIGRSMDKFGPLAGVAFTGVADVVENAAVVTAANGVPAALTRDPTNDCWLAMLRPSL